MKKLLLIVGVSLGLAGCSQSDVGYQGSAPEAERGTATMNAPPDRVESPDPARDSGIGRSIAPSVPAPTLPPTGAPAQSETPAPSEQGVQTTPEPSTGDDANPDAIHP